LLEELGYPQPGPTVIQQNNNSTVMMARKGELGTKRTKHFTVRHYFVSELIAQGSVALIREPGKRILADGLTKPFSGNHATTWAHALLGT